MPAENKQHYFIVGGGILQYEFVKTVKQQGFITHVFDYNPQCICAKLADFFHCISIDEKEKILEIAKQYHAVAIQTNATEMGNISACYVGEKLGLCTNSYQTALDTTDKSRMKKIFKKFNIPSAQYAEFTNLSEVDLNNIQFPVVVKASDRSAGRGVRKVNNLTEFKEAFVDALKESHNKKVLVEEYLVGPQYSVEMISSHGIHQLVAITEVTPNNTCYFVSSRHMLPANLSQVNMKEIENFAIKTLHAFHVQYGASHIEIKNTHTGIKIIELATRMGGWRDLLVKYALGCNFDELLIEASLGREVKPFYTKNLYSVIVFMVNKQNFELYQKIKKEHPELITFEDVHYKGLPEAKTLMESQGFCCLLFDDKESAEKILRGGE